MWLNGWQLRQKKRKTPMTKNLGPHMPLYLDRFLGGTMAFEAHEVGAYILLIAHQWQHGGIENDERMIERVARCEYAKMRRVLAKFQKQADGTLVNAACAKIRAERDEFIRLQSEKGKKGMAVRWNDSKTDNSGNNGGNNSGYNQRYNLTDTDTDTTIRIPTTDTDTILRGSSSS
jgi:uncharacterized protein YdaU (DUF1376 family)